MKQQQPNPTPKGSIWTHQTTGDRVMVTTSAPKPDARYINRTEKVEIQLLSDSMPLLTGTIDLGDLLDGFKRVDHHQEQAANDKMHADHIERRKADKHSHISTMPDGRTISFRRLF